MNEETSELVAGGVVVLKSGGHEMTVEKIEGPHIHCIWSDGKRVRRDTFPRELLRDSQRVTGLHIKFTPSPNDIDQAVKDLCNLRPDEMTDDRLREVLSRHF